MKVLWVSVDPCGAKAIISPNYVLGGWLTALEKGITENTNIELHECYFCNKEIKDFEYNSVFNHPIYDSFYSSKMFFILSQIAILLGKALHDRRIERIVDTIKKVKPDLVHIHGTETELGTISQLIPEIPCIISIQGIISPIHNKLYAGIPYAEVCKGDTIRRYFTLSASVFNRKGWNLYEEREKKILGSAKYIIGRTSWDRNVASILAPNAHYFVGNEILRQQFYDAQPWNKECFSEIFTIVSVITGGLFKGLETVLRSAVLLKQRNIKYKWLIVGQKSDSPNTKLFENYCQIKGNQVNIEYLGLKNTDELVSILREADLYVQPSHIENSPNSVCEAMLLGLPVIATMAGGTPTILGEDNLDFMVQEGEYYSLAGAIMNLANNFEKAQQQSVKNREIALTRHDQKKIINEYLSAYNYIIDHNKRKEV